LSLAGFLIGAHFIRRAVQWFNRRDNPNFEPDREHDSLRISPRGPAQSRSRQAGRFVRAWFGPDLPN
jgi:hypothetical protein